MARALAEQAEEVVAQALLSPNMLANRQLKLGEWLTGKAGRHVQQPYGAGGGAPAGCPLASPLMSVLISSTNPMPGAC